MKRLSNWLAIPVLAALAVTIVSGLALESKAAPGTGTLFGTDARGGNLITVDQTTGSGTIIGSMNAGVVPSLAVDLTTGIMYAGGGGGAPNLYTVDPASGLATLVGSSGLGFAAIGGMDFASDGTLYAAVNIAGDGGTGSDHLATINPATGAATIVGSFGSCVGVVVPSGGGGSCTIEGIEAIAFDASGTLWAAKTARGAAGAPGLYVINPSTGAATFVIAILDAVGNPPSGGVTSLQFTCDGTLFGGTATGIFVPDGGRLITIDPSSGLFAFVGSLTATSFGQSLGALAFQDPCVEGPTSIEVSKTASFDGRFVSGTISITNVGGNPALISAVADSLEVHFPVESPPPPLPKGTLDDPCPAFENTLPINGGVDCLPVSIDGDPVDPNADCNEDLIPNECQCGDINRSGTIDLQDAILAFNCIPPTPAVLQPICDPPTATGIGDANASGSYDLQDAILIFNAQPGRAFPPSFLRCPNRPEGTPVRTWFKVADVPVAAPGLIEVGETVDIDYSFDLCFAQDFEGANAMRNVVAVTLANKPEHAPDTVVTRSESFEPQTPEDCPVGLPCVEPVPGPLGWTPRARVPIGVEGATGVIIGSKIYVTHGFLPGDGTATQIYDIPTDTWDPPGANANVARSELAGVCAIEDGVPRLFAIGGRPPQTTVEVYDPGTDTWTPGAPMLTARRGLCATYVPTVGPQGTIYAIGGGTGDSVPHSGVATGANEAYDVAAGVWAPRAPMPTPVMGIYACLWHPGTNLVYVFGGFDSTAGAVSNLVQRYDPVADAWLPNGASMPTARSNAIAGICSNDIYVIGGLNPGVSNNRIENERYDPVANAWAAAPVLPSPRSEMASTAISTGQAIYAIGSGAFGLAANPHDRFECQ